jgi:hypothetical protein
MPNQRYGIAGWLTVAACLYSAGSLAWAQSASAPLLTPSQYQNDSLALSLRDDPAMIAAREAMLARWGASPLNDTPDGKATLAEAVDEAVFLALRSAAADPSRPQVLWTEAPAYEIGDLHIPAGRLGDSPDRIYRFAACDPQYRYIIHGQRNARPSLGEFSFEATKPPAAFGAALSHLSSDEIDVAADGSFTVTADATPVNGRRNHLYLPPGTTHVLIRDTLLDWGAQLPNDLKIERVGGEPRAPRDHAALAREAAAEIGDLAEIQAPFLQMVSQTPPDEITPRIRPLAWGMPGSGIALNRFSLKKGEALVVTLDPLGGKYLGFVVGDPWQRSVAYWNRTGSLNNRQARPNPDGTITYVLAAEDPGVYNWLDTNGLRDGVVTLRWEGMPPTADIHSAVKSVKVTRIADLATAIPDARRVATDERRQILAQRQADFARRTSTN